MIFSIFLSFLYGKKMIFKPLINLRSTTIFKAFLLNALVLALVAGMSIELRGYMDIREQTKNLSRFRKMTITIIGTSIMGFFLFILARVMLGYGGGLLADTPNYPTLF